MRAKDRHIKPHFTVNGQIWFVEKDLDPQYFEFSKHPCARVWFGPEGIRRLIDVYHWWKKKDPENARITDAMLLRHCDAYQLVCGYGRAKYGVVLRDPVSVFIQYPGSVHSRNWLNRKIPHLSKDQRANAKHYLLSGYCRVSNQHMMISRIDRPDWREVLAVHFCPHDPEEGMDRTYSDGAADYYRRCLSKDKLTLKDKALYQMFPGSGGGHSHFIPLCEEFDDVQSE
ncbi:TPA: hypothetical protein ACXYQ5_005014 [Klebsiella pneumoniae]